MSKYEEWKQMLAQFYNGEAYDEICEIIDKAEKYEERINNLEQEKMSRVHSEETICELLQKNRDNDIYYIKIDNRLSMWYGDDDGKLASEVYPNHHDRIQNINNYTEEIIYPISSDVYQKYFKNEENKPFICEVWKRENNIIKLLYFRRDENSDFIEVLEDE